MKLSKILLILTLLLFFASCQEDPTTDPDIITDPMEMEYDGNTPIVMLHGTLAAGDTYGKQIQRFVANGYLQSELYVFDWNSLIGQSVQDLDVFIDNVLLNTGAPTVNLVGHSAGGGFASNYLSDSTRVLKVKRYAHIAGTALSGPAGPNGEVPTLNLYSPADMAVPGMDIPGAENVSIPDLDHYEIATSKESFIALYKFFHDDVQPGISEPIESPQVMLSGRVVTLGENAIKQNVLVEIYALEDGSANRIDVNPNASLMTDGDGYWGNFEAEKNRRYEFVISDPDDPDFRKLHYYREGFITSDSHVYLRAFPTPGTIASLLLSSLPSDDAQSVIAVFSANQAIINGRDELLFENESVATAPLTSADQTTIALFAYDDGDEMSSYNPHPEFSFSPFLNGVDIFNATDVEESIELVFNGRSLFVKNWKSQAEGVSVLVFN